MSLDLQTASSLPPLRRKQHQKTKYLSKDRCIAYLQSFQEQRSKESHTPFLGFTLFHKD
jgi:hypothetical protein